MSKTTNTVPYTNARRAGRTNPDKVEILPDTDPRSRRYRKPIPDNRAGRRARGLYRGVTRSQVARHWDRKTHGRKAVAA